MFAGVVPPPEGWRSGGAKVGVLLAILPSHVKSSVESFNIYVQRSEHGRERVEARGNVGGTATERSISTGELIRPPAGEPDADDEEPGALFAVAALVVFSLACLLALLPVAIALGVLSLPGGLVAPAATVLGATFLIAKSLAIIWGLAARALSSLEPAAAAARVG